MITVDIAKNIMERNGDFDSLRKIMFLEEHGIKINEYQLWKIAGFNRGFGKTFASYCNAVIDCKDGGIVVPYGDEDLNGTRQRKLEWVKGFVQFLEKYFPEVSFDVRMSVPQVEIHKIKRIENGW